MNKTERKRYTFYLRPEVNDNLDKMSKFLGVPKSRLLEDLIDDASKSFLKIVEDGKTLSVAAMLEVLADKLKDVSTDLKGMKNE